MSFSFDPTFPTQMDAARSVLRDIDPTDPILQNEEITANLINNGWNDGVALCATSMAGEFARRASEYKAGSTDAEFQYKDRVRFYEDLAGLARKGAIAPPSPTIRPVDAPTTSSYPGACKVRHELLDNRGGGYGGWGGW